MSIPFIFSLILGNHKCNNIRCICKIFHVSVNQNINAVRMKRPPQVFTCLRLCLLVAPLQCAEVFNTQNANFRIMAGNTGTSADTRMSKSVYFILLTVVMLNHVKSSHCIILFYDRSGTAASLETAARASVAPQRTLLVVSSLRFHHLSF